MKSFIYITIFSLTIVYLVQAAFVGKRVTYGLLVALILLLFVKFFKFKHG